MKAPHLIAALLLAGSAAHAQPPADGPSSEVLQSCLLGTPTTVWTNLKLTSDQLRRMLLVQEACKEECDVARANKQPNPISNADGSTILAEVDNILSSAQYEAWVAYCAAIE
jgi:hypothetical protein